MCNSGMVQYVQCTVCVHFQPTVQFQVAHVLELQGHSSQARRKYEVLLGCRTLPPHVKALTQKQLGTRT